MQSEDIAQLAIGDLVKIDFLPGVRPDYGKIISKNGDKIEIRIFGQQDPIEVSSNDTLRHIGFIPLTHQLLDAVGFQNITPDLSAEIVTFVVENGIQLRQLSLECEHDAWYVLGDNNERIQTITYIHELLIIMSKMFGDKMECLFYDRICRKLSSM
jgi:hypothetical protein